MKSTVLCTLCFLSLTFTASYAVSPGIAFAKPPSWAPAHGYRRKHHDEDHDRHKDKEEKKEIHSIESIPVILNDRFSSVFRTLDLNHDGIISIYEFNEGNSLFARLDKNRDGYLTLVEYRAVEEERGLLTGFFYKVKNKISSFVSWLF